MLKFLFVLSCVLLSSCATILNKSQNGILIKSNELVEIIVNDTLKSNSKKYNHYFVIKRSKKPLILNVKADSLNESLKVASKLSNTVYLNALTPGLVGIIVDVFSQKSFEYPSEINLNIENSKITYVNQFNPKINSTTYIKKKNIFLITPIKLIIPSIEVAYEYRLNNQYSIQAEYLQYIPNTNWINNKGLKSGIELKRYFKNYISNSTYLSLHLDYLKKSFSNELKFYNIDRGMFDENDIIRDKFRIYRKTRSANLKFGYQVLLTNKLLLDSYVGIGIKYREVKYDKIIPDNYQIMSNHDFTFSSRREGRFFDYNIIGNIRFGYAF